MSHLEQNEEQVRNDEMRRTRSDCDRQVGPNLFEKVEMTRNDRRLLLGQRTALNVVLTKEKRETILMK